MAAAVAGTLVLAACDASEPTVVEPSRPDTSAILAAREAYAQPATDLGREVQALEVDVRAMRLEVPDSAADGEPDEAGRTFLIDQAVEAVSDLEQLVEAQADVFPRDDGADAAAGDPTTEPAVQAAIDAWDRAIGAAREAIEAARTEIDVARDLLAAEQSMAATAALWDQRGSRSQQIERLDAAADGAEAMAAEMVGWTNVPDCSTAVQRRVDAVVLVAERTRELHGYVARGQGGSFDEARASYDEDPWFEGLVQDDRTPAEAACWDRSSGVVTAGDDVLAALDDLVEALNTGVAPSVAESDRTDASS